MNQFDAEYAKYARHILKNGALKGDRTGTGTYSYFGYQMRFNLDQGFPLLTTKKINFKSVAEELFWFLKGNTNIKQLVDKNVNIWVDWPYDKFCKDLLKENPNSEVPSRKEFISMIHNDPEFADQHGWLGPVYGKQWRDFGGVDQIQEVIDKLQNRPDDRRMIVSAWNVPEIPEMLLPPCHLLFQFWTRELTLIERLDWMRANLILPNDGTEAETHEELDDIGVPRRGVSMQMYQRSCDTFLGVPFNIASYSLLLAMIGKQVNMKPLEFIWVGGDVHIYTNHVQQIQTQLAREPKNAPRLIVRNKKPTIFDYTYDDLNLVDYDPHPFIGAAVAV